MAECKRNGNYLLWYVFVLFRNRILGRRENMTGKDILNGNELFEGLCEITDGQR